MIIGIDASRANRKFKTGTEWYGYHLIQELKKIPIKDGDCFILYYSDKLRGDLGKLPKGWQGRQLRWPFTYLWTQIRLLWEMIVRPVDVLFIPSHTLPFFCRIKSVVTIHDICFEKYPQCYSLFQRVYYKVVHRRTAKIAAYIIVPSQFSKEQLMELYKVPADKIYVIPLAYDKKSYYFVNDEEKVKSVFKKYKIKQPYFLFVGRLEEKKNVKGLVRAYKQLTIDNKQLTVPDLVLVGRPGYGYKEVKCQTSNVKCIKEIGYVEEEDLKYLYSGAKAFIFPSLCEGFGIPILEAMAHGCPVLASNSGSIPEVGGNAALYFNSNSIGGMARAMKKIIIDSNIAQELRKKGLARVKNFSWEKCAKQSMKVLIE